MSDNTTPSRKLTGNIDKDILAMDLCASLMEDRRIEPDNFVEVLSEMRALLGDNVSRRHIRVGGKILFLTPSSLLNRLFECLAPFWFVVTAFFWNAVWAAKAKLFRVPSAITKVLKALVYKLGITSHKPKNPPAQAALRLNQYLSNRGIGVLRYPIITDEAYTEAIKKRLEAYTSVSSADVGPCQIERLKALDMGRAVQILEFEADEVDPLESERSDFIKRELERQGHAKALEVIEEGNDPDLKA